MWNVLLKKLNIFCQTIFPVHSAGEDHVIQQIKMEVARPPLYN